MECKSRKLLSSAIAVVVAAFGLAACGGASKSTTSTTKSTTTATHTTPAHATIPLESVRVDPSQTYAVSGTANPADAVSFRTVVPPTEKGSPVHIKLEAGPAKTLTVTATVGSKSGTTTLSSASGKSLSLLDVHYSCTLPPVPSFCPAQSTKKNAHGYTLQFSSRAAAAIQVSALVGPLNLPKPQVTPAGTSVVPPYTVTEVLRVRTPGATTSSAAQPPATPTVSAKPGQLVVMYSELKASVHGAKQPITVTINQGPAKSLTITAAAKGGAASTATVKSATGAPIALVLPHYTCYVTPTPTFCPASSIKAAPHRYTVTFAAAPGTATIELQALAQS